MTRVRQVQNINLAEILLAAEKIKAARRQGDLMEMQMAQAPAQQAAAARDADLKRQIQLANLDKIRQGTASAEETRTRNAETAARDAAARRLAAQEYSLRAMKERPDLAGVIAEGLHGQDPDAAQIFHGLNVDDPSSFAALEQDLAAQREALAPTAPLAPNKDLALALAAGVPEDEANRLLWEKRIAKSGPLVSIGSIGAQGSSDLTKGTTERAQKALVDAEPMLQDLTRVYNMGQEAGGYARYLGAGPETKQFLLRGADWLTSGHGLSAEQKKSLGAKTAFDTVIKKIKAGELKALLGSAQSEAELRNLAGTLASTDMGPTEFAPVFHLFMEKVMTAVQINQTILAEKRLEVGTPEYTAELNNKWQAIKTAKGWGGGGAGITADPMGSGAAAPAPRRKQPPTQARPADEDQEGADLLSALEID